MTFNATYRLQLHHEFTLRHLDRIIPYLEQLGISFVYASPVFKALPGSTHGYDVLDPHLINPEIGTEEELRAIVEKLHAKGIRWIQDIVPNHMCFDARNPWLCDLMEKGPQSVYADFFDTTWADDFFQGRLMVPFLGAQPEELIERGELKVAYQDGRLVLSCSGNWPLQPLSYAKVLRAVDPPEAISVLLEQLPKTEEKEAYAKAWNEFRLQLTSLMKNAAAAAHMQACLERVNGDPDMLRRLQAEQSYQLCFWRDSDARMNYRRFFTVNALICLNMHHPDVFHHYHQLIEKLLREGMFDGLRVDHVDGIFDPSEYLERLRALAGEHIPIVVEKILEPGEPLPETWPIQGNTGYDFLSLVNNLLTDQSALPQFDALYRSLTGDERTPEEQVYEKKSHILFEHMQGELDNLTRFFTALGFAEDVPQDELRQAIGQLLVQCPVYRYYGNQFPLEAEETSALRSLIQAVREQLPHCAAAVDRLEYIFLDLPLSADEETNKKIARLYRRMMQFTGPLMAKGVEDTLMYTYHRFIAHNEVGDAPGAFGMSVEAFHEAMSERQQLWPLSLNATSTHDTKRGEDVRARLNVLTAMPEEWRRTVHEWRKMNASLKKDGLPGANDEYFIYQTLAGAYPMPGTTDPNFEQRIHDYLQKAMREAKLYSGWAEPDEHYEQAVQDFLSALLNRNGQFIGSLESFVERIATPGIANALVQVFLKFTCPGVPDVYQGCELWDLSQVDPDNRRPVDYERRQALLDEVTKAKDIKALWRDRYNGGIKLWLVNRLMQLRRTHPEAFSSGVYIPLEVKGPCKEKVIAFARRYRQELFIAAAVLHHGIDRPDWKDTVIVLPRGAGEEWEHLLSGEQDHHKKEIRAAHLFRDLPIALLQGKRLLPERNAGILVHLSSLPSPFGVGDMGQEARGFIDLLERCNQRYWQLLPLNPVEKEQGYSPYSSVSSRAGNTLFISPELLADEGLLQPADLDAYRLPCNEQADLEGAEAARKVLLDKAWQTFHENPSPDMNAAFRAFCAAEKEWLDDYALYVVLKAAQDKPWHQWEEALRLRKPEALEKIRKENTSGLEKVRWLQFIFSRQWQALKQYANERGVQLIGDLPFYVSHDSADVWANPHLFSLDATGQVSGTAGVPPDAFSEDGQLWGMPVYNWEALKAENYAWWIARLKKNTELFDRVRLDHFRAFSEYWEVPPGETTARNGSWKPGPGAAFFEAVQAALGQLPFIAEDLGEIDDKVYLLRDAFGLPGMKVLQFAFGKDMPGSTHIPHHHARNFIVYTGTHDNNTTRGWFTKDADEKTVLSLETYVGRPLSAAEVSGVLCRMAFASVARDAIIPIQDLLNLDEQARMNRPASASGNWSWRLLPEQVGTQAEHHLKQWTKLYDRE